MKKESKIEFVVICECGSQNMEIQTFISSTGNYVIINCLDCNKSISIVPTVLKESDN